MSTHDLHLEKQVIGAVMLSPNLLSRANHITEEVFSDETHAQTWTLVVTAILAGESITPSNLWKFDRTTVTKIGGMDVLQDYRESGRSILTEADVHIQKLHEIFQWRKISQIAQRLDAVSKRQDKSPEDVLSNLTMLSNNLLANGKDNSRNKKQVIQEAIQRVSQKRDIVTTGITSLDFLMQGGLQSKRVYGFGGIYGRGKTILLGTISDNLNIQDVPHLFISLETDPEDIELRNCAKYFNTNASLLADPNSEYHDTLSSGANSYIDNVENKTWYEFSPGATMNELHRMILRAKSRHNIKGFIIDYWQLIEGRERGQSEEAHHRSNANRLAALCRKEDLWCIVTAQIDHTGKLKYSDSLLQAAALFIKIIREEDEEEVHFEIQKSNYTRYGDTFSTSSPSALFDMASGPHFRDVESIDIGRLGEDDEDDKIDL
jgi:replicative DNA helicase